MRRPAHRLPSRTMHLPANSGTRDDLRSLAAIPRRHLAPHRPKLPCRSGLRRHARPPQADVAAGDRATEWPSQSDGLHLRYRDCLLSAGSSVPGWPSASSSPPDLQVSHSSAISLSDCTLACSGGDSALQQRFPDMGPSRPSCRPLQPGPPAPHQGALVDTRRQQRRPLQQRSPDMGPLGPVLPPLQPDPPAPHHRALVDTLRQQRRPLQQRSPDMGPSARSCRPSSQTHPRPHHRALVDTPPATAPTAPAALART